MKKIFLVICTVIILYIFYAVYELETSHPRMIVYAAYASNYDYENSRLPPVPFRKNIAIRKFQSMSLEDFSNIAVFELNLYSVLGVKKYSEKLPNDSQSRLEKMADHLLDLGVEIDIKNIHGCSALELAFLNNDNQAIDYLLKKGANSYDLRRIKENGRCL